MEYTLVSFREHSKNNLHIKYKKTTIKSGIIFRNYRLKIARDVTDTLKVSVT